MKKESAKEMIEKFKLRKEEKDKLFFINESIEKAINSKKNYNLVITIDNMPIKDISKYISYIKRIGEKYGIINISKYNDSNFRRLKQSKKFIWYDYDDNPSWSMRRDSEELEQSISTILSKNNIIIITSSKSLDKYDAFTDNNLLKYLPHISFHGEMDEEKEYKKLIYKYKHNSIPYDMKLDDFNKIVERVGDNDYIKKFRISDYLYEYSTVNSLNKDIVQASTFNELMEDKESNIKFEKKQSVNIDDLTGLNNVKDELNKLFHYVEFLKNHNINRDGTYLNMFFLGNPGTGKTMIANIIADKLYKLGFIEKNEVVKVIPTDLIGEYVGQTRRKVRDILDKAKGKILFIDEAYLLYNGSYKNGNNPYMQEAIVELLKYLENVNNITIFAGYKDEMMKIYQTNPGVKSRIYKEIIFDDYSIDELYDILEKDLNKKGFSIQGIHKQFIEKHIDKMKKEKSFGNARSMKQLAQKLIINHANNYANNKTLEELIITKVDIPEDNFEEKLEMGFGE